MNKNILDFEIQGHKVGIYGLQGSGKTECAKYLLRKKFKAPMVWSPHKHDWKDQLVYHYLPRDMKKEIEPFLGKCIELANKDKIDCIVIDEADMVFRNNFEMGVNAIDLFSNHRHYPEGRGVSVILVSRRPQDLPTMFVEACRLLIVYKLEGDNVRRKFNGIKEGFGEKITNDDFKYNSYEFFIKEIGQPEYLHQKLDIKQKKKEKSISADEI